MSRSVMNHSFAEVPRANIPRSSFQRPSNFKLAFDADYLVPIFFEDVLPGDSHNLKASLFARLATPLHPIMDNLYLDTFFFFVPYRLVWDNWAKFCGAQDNPADSIDFTIPVISSDTAHDSTAANSFNYLFDYFGLPYKASVDLSELSVLPFRAYNLIYNEWFRDQNLQDSLTVNTDNGPDATTDYNLVKRGKRHDYFTSCLPWPQKGDAVEIPLFGTSGAAPITGLSIVASNTPTTGPSSTVEETGGNTLTYDYHFNTAADSFFMDSDASGTPEVFADLANVTGAGNINDLRQAFQIQKVFERDARSGTRYNEHVLAHFGVQVPDFRIQRPEFLGGGSSRINVTPVPNTSEDSTSKQGDLTGYATVSDTHSFTKSFVEHGIIIGLANVRADITYSQGVDRYWTKSTRFDFYLPLLSQIGEQAVLNREIYYTNTSTDEDVFGYQERSAEYRYKPSRLASVFRPTHSATLAPWHLSEEFVTLPTLGDTFIQSNTSVPLDRAVAYPSQPHILADFFFDLRSARPMPVYGVPGNMDRL